MTQPSHLVYVISDLHLGGAPPTQPGDSRGFRICTQVDALASFISSLAALPCRPDAPRIELCINGDFIDFLAEETPGEGWNGSPWSPLKHDAQIACHLLQRVIERNKQVFTALSALVRAGHTLTLLLGNHDIELAFPAVRRALADALGIPQSTSLRFFHDGEAYPIGDALIEHGNRYDPFNVVDQDALRRVCSLQSRGQAVSEDRRVPVPPGSQLVAEIMNPLKQDYPFIDLLKPESTAAVPLLLALEPGARKHVARLSSLALSAARVRYASPAMPMRSGDISAAAAHSAPIRGGDMAARAGNLTARAAAPTPAEVSSEADLQTVLTQALGPQQAALFLQQLQPPEVGPVLRSGGDISAPALASSWSGRLGLAKLFFSSSSAALESRLAALSSAIRAFAEPDLFELHRDEPESPYFKAADELASGGFRYIVMGHTHLARDQKLSGGGRYLNSGTWADLIRLPATVFSTDPAAAQDALRQLLMDLHERRISHLIWQRPTYVRLELSQGVVSSASVEEYRAGHGPL